MTEPNFLDRAIAYFAPTMGAQRAQARAVIAALSYEGAVKTRADAGWLSASTSADSEIATVRSALRDRARDLVRNNPHAEKGLAVLVSHTIGTGILMQASGKNDRINKRVTERLKRWIDNCDLAGQMDLWGIESLAERTRRESGEVLVRFVPVAIDDVRDVPLRLQVLEPDHLDGSKHGVTDSTTTREGIEYDKLNRPLAYWLFDAHPGDTVAGTSARRQTQSTRIPASQIVHYYKPLRAGQLRGATDFATVIKRLRDLDDYDMSERTRKKVAACSIGAVTTPNGLPLAGGTLAPLTIDEQGRKIEGFAPGMFHYMRPGEQVSFYDPKPSDDYEPYNKVQLRAIAAGLKVPYELLTGDLTDVNYTSHRGGLVQFRALVEADQWQVAIMRLCLPIWKRFLVASMLPDSLITPDLPAIFTPPRFGLLDPAREIPATIQAIQGGIDSYPNALRSLGYDWKERLDEIEEWKKELDARKLILTSDGSMNSGPSSQRFENNPAGGAVGGGAPGGNSPEPKEEKDEDADEKAA